MAGETFESGGGAPSAYEVNDSDFEVSDVEGDMIEEERATKQKEKIKKKMNERVEKKALALFNERIVGVYRQASSGIPLAVGFVGRDRLL